MTSVVPARDRWALAIALALPTLITLVYFVWLAEAAAIVYGPLKILQFAFPLIWVYGVRRGQSALHWEAPQRAPSLVWGAFFGLAVSLAGYSVYRWWLLPSGFFDASLPAIHAKVADIGLTSPGLFVACGVFYALVHSLLEEYYWRWFVYRECRGQMTLAPAVVVSSLGFAAHHVLVLAEYFRWDAPITYLFALAVAVGGAFWAWLYERYRTLLGPWVGHLLIDAMIFAIGYDLVFGGRVVSAASGL